MISSLLASRLGRRMLPLVPFSFAIVLLAGCNDEYAEDLKYEPRTDPIVSASLETIPDRIDKPGDFPHLFGLLNEKDQAKVLDPLKLSAEDRKQISQLLDENFGTPAEPMVKGLEPEEESTLKLDQKTLAQGSRLFRMHCLHCHGVTGNGRGPTAPWVNPHPRDYRQGIFKFMAVRGNNQRKPSRKDLLHTLQQGVEGTSMPSFGLLPEHELNALASYVIHLSMRGQLELMLMQGRLSDDSFVVKDSFGDYFEAIKKNWLDASSTKNWIQPDAKVASAVHFPPTIEDREAVQRGWTLFQSKAGCLGCHMDYGRQANYFFDAWGTIGRPADLTQGVYRGGRRPLDLFYRLYAGVNGSSMPASGKMGSGEASLTEQDMWDIISFLQVLPHKKMREQFGIDIERAPEQKVARAGQ